MTTITLTEADMLEVIEKMDELEMMELGLVKRIETMTDDEIDEFITDLENNNVCATPKIVEAVMCRLYVMRAEIVAKFPEDLRPLVEKLDRQVH